MSDLFGPTPIIRFELQGLKYHVLHALGGHHKDIQASAEAELAKVIENFDFAGMIRNEATRVLEQVVKESVKHHFSYGEGRKIIQDAVAKALTNEAAHD